jgi:transposase
LQSSLKDLDAAYQNFFRRVKQGGVPGFPNFKSNRKSRKSEKKLSRLQRKLSRKSKGGGNREKARLLAARTRERISNQRTDASHKLSTQIVKDYDVIAIEDLRVKNMARNHKLAKSISDASWSEFARVDSFYPSSQLCGARGHQNAATKNLAVREWTCPECGTRHDRGVNTAKNILREGLRLTAYSPNIAVRRDTPEPNARGVQVRPRTARAAVAEPRIPRL